MLILSVVARCSWRCLRAIYMRQAVVHPRRHFSAVHIRVSAAEKPLGGVSFAARA
jgi:hypothetical protein